MRPPEPNFGVEHLEKYGPDIHPCMLWWDGVPEWIDQARQDPDNRAPDCPAFIIDGPGQVRIGTTYINVDKHCHAGSEMPDLGITKEQRREFWKAFWTRKPLEVRTGPTLEEMTSVKK